MQFLTDKECIATENFSRGIIYHIEMTSDEMYAVCVAIGYNYVQFIDDTGKIFCLSDQTKDNYVAIDEYTPVEPEPPISNLLQYQTGVLPFEFNTTDTSLFSWYIKGNTVQNGTPTPQSPVDVVGVGELETSGEYSGQYKIPISSANITTPVYLGKVETTRRVKKLVLTGQESWSSSTAGGKTFYLTTVSDAYNGYLAILSNCYEGSNAQAALRPDNSIRQTSGTNSGYINILDMACASRDAFKTFLAERYAANNPVVVYYILATATTGIVNEPLMKIGDYADSITSEQAIIQIPTIVGDNTLSVDTTVQPSEMQIVYKIADR